MRSILERRYGRALGSHIHRALDVLVWVIIFWLILASFKEAYCAEEAPMATLYVFYKPTLEKPLFNIMRYRVLKSDCPALALVVKDLKKLQVVYVGCL